MKRRQVFTDDGSTVPVASLKVKVTDPDAAPPAPLTSQVTVVPTLTMMFDGHLTVAFGMPCAARDFSTAASAVSPGPGPIRA